MLRIAVIHEEGTVTYIGGCSDSPECMTEVRFPRQSAKFVVSFLQEQISML